MLGGITLSLSEAMAFAALISAIDPVSALAIFGALKIQPTLNMTVFGESVINDAVAIALFRTFARSLWGNFEGVQVRGCAFVESNGSPPERPAALDARALMSETALPLKAPRDHQLRFGCVLELRPLPTTSERERQVLSATTDGPTAPFEFGACFATSARSSSPSGSLR